MSVTPQRWVEKVHPLTRDAEAADPMELVATPAPGDPDYMLECVVMEFAMMGFSDDELLRLFRSPDYPVLNALLTQYGEAEVRQRVEDLLRPLRAVRITETIAEDEPEPEEDEGPDLMQVSLDRIRRG